MRPFVYLREQLIQFKLTILISPSQDSGLKHFDMYSETRPLLTCLFYSYIFMWGGLTYEETVTLASLQMDLLVVHVQLCTRNRSLWFTFRNDCRDRMTLGTLWQTLELHGFYIHCWPKSYVTAAFLGKNLDLIHSRFNMYGFRSYLFLYIRYVG